MRMDELLKGAYERLSSISDTAQLDAQLLLAHVLAVSTAYFYTWPEKEVGATDMERFNSLLARRERGEPVAYLLGHQAFWSLDLDVAPCTLIPRADTERLVEVALSVLDRNRASRILDLGTGTGAIALALASELPKSTVVGVDLVDDAVALAKRNALRHQLGNASFVQSSWFAALAGCEPFDLIVSNPPYIDPDDEHLSLGDVRFEPKSALVAENHGMADIEHIICLAPNYMAPNAYLMFEHGYDQAAAVRASLSEAGFVAVESFQDFGGNDRVTIGQYR
ncbi:peptide chain release factor N(5)-glutamine methyltransferase [Marinomonas sp. M1K-6]|uniref:Release factor glutamine methyltransferase n=1 Tax=Marinomonas profundi TaxID=2726122 RepID=A0A847R4T5_9GAMM|nr:peptide chain release factor N(5)-glutamine methyltransferase [Marinomonas profundi]NLQ19022.1 peptide chain release factor N(5)-glutamine methyltransferase [Marinomonas profundi]UDV02065.1 peptide chain release factor N(5)-glutamine methyltransferase [Marinomonas profundi]